MNLKYWFWAITGITPDDVDYFKDYWFNYMYWLLW